MTATPLVPDAAALVGDGDAPRVRKRRVVRGVALWVACAWIALMVLLAIFADLLSLPAPDAPVGASSIPPFTDWSVPLGTDVIGRDMLSRLIYGIRISLSIGLGATVIAATLGTLLGLAAAYFRGWVAGVANVLSDTVLAFPPLLVLLALAAVVTPGVPSLTFAIGFLFIPPFLRLARAAASAQLGRDYVVAARTLGARAGRIIFRELLPNAIQPVISYAVVIVALVIVIEGSLSFLGVGVPPPAPSWGSMIASAKDQLRYAPYLLVAPSLMIFFTVFAFNTAGDALRRRLTGSGN